METKKTILYAEDTLATREILKDFFTCEFAKYNLDICKDGGELEFKLKQDLEDVAVILTDNNMPLRKGIELIEQYSDKGIPMILYSADKSVWQQAKKVGAYAFVQKPFDIEYLFSVFQNAIDEKKFNWEDVPFDSRCL